MINQSFDNKLDEVQERLEQTPTSCKTKNKSPIKILKTHIMPMFFCTIKQELEIFENFTIGQKHWYRTRCFLYGSCSLKLQKLTKAGLF